MSALRAAVVGCGHFGGHHADKYAASPAARLVAVVDRDPDAARSLAERLGAQALPRADDLIGRVDVASVAVPTSEHFAVAGLLLEGGVDVLLEKPIAATLAEADALIALAARHRRVLQVGHLERFNAAILALDDVLGRPLFVESHRVAPFSQRGTDVDVVLDLMIHDIDLIQLLVGAPLVAVDAVGVPVLSARDDIVNARLQFEGCVVNVTASRVSFKSERRMRLFQRDAYVSIDFSAGSAVIARKDADASSGLMPGIALERRSIGANDALMLQIEAFLGAVRGERPVAVSGEDGRRALDTALRISRALRRPG